MDAGWNAPIPCSLHDGPGMLWFCLAWCVRRRISDRDEARQKQQDRIRRVAQCKRKINHGLLPCDIDSPSNYYFAPLESVPPDVPAKSERMAVFRNEVAQRRLHATASWLFHFFHDEPLLMRVHCDSGFLVRFDGFRPYPSSGVNAVASLRTSCRHWRSLLPLLHCCDCGNDCRIGDFRGWWVFTLKGGYGPVPCKQCYSICTYHLSCSRCNRRAVERFSRAYSSC